MSSTTIQIGDGQDAFVFDVPPEFAPRVQVLRNANGVRIGEFHTWPVRGYLRGAGPENINALWSSLHVKLQVEQVNVYFKHGETVLQQLLASESEKGPKFDGPSIEPGDETCWDTNLEFSFEVTAEIYETQSGVIEVEHTMDYRQNEDGSYTHTKSGRLRTESGTSAHQAAIEQVPDVPVGYKLTSVSVTPNDEDTEASFSFTMQSLFAALPQQVNIARRTVEESLDNGVKTTTCRATFTGEGALQAAQEFRPEGKVTGESIVTSEDENTVSVTYTVQEPADGTHRLRYFNSVSIQPGEAELDIFPMGGQAPLIQVGAQRAATIVEDGYEVWNGSVPPVHPALVDGKIHVYNRSTAVRPWSHDAGGLPVAWIRTWNYTYKSSEKLDTPEALTQLESRMLEER